MIYNTIGKLTNTFSKSPNKNQQRRNRFSVALFVCGKEKEMANTIYCPSCKRKVGTYDGRSTIPKVIDCRKCNKRVVYNPESGTTIKNIPLRNSSSGVTFH